MAWGLRFRFSCVKIVAVTRVFEKYNSHIITSNSES